MRRVLLIPGWMKTIVLYDKKSGLEIRSGAITQEIAEADCIFALSLAALTALESAEKIKGKLILLNPPLPKRPLFDWLWRWFQYILHEGLFPQKQKFYWNPIKFIITLLNCIRLLRQDFSETIRRFPKEKLVIIRGRKDIYFCDAETAALAKRWNIKILEVTGGHNWSSEMEAAIKKLTL